MKTKKGVSAGAVVGIGAAAVAASVAAYLLFGPDGKKNRKVVRGWAVKMKGEVIEKLESLKELSEPIYHNVVDTIAKKYKTVKNIDKKEFDATVADMKKHWRAVSKGMKGKPKRKTASKKKAASKKKK